MKIGLFGGSFNPVHIGHLRAAEIFCQKQELDSLYVVPAHVSPFKTEKDSLYISDADRLNMARLCFSHLESGTKVNVSDMEISRGGTSYTIDTVNALLEKTGQNKIYMLVGSDMFLSLEKWKSFEELFEKCVICTLSRNADELNLLRAKSKEYFLRYGAQTEIYSDEPLEVSATRIRSLFACGKGENCRNMLTADVFEYIIENRLFTESADKAENLFTHEPTSSSTLERIRGKIPEFLTPKRLIHTLSVEKQALEIAEPMFEKLGIDKEYLSDISAAALLHDITKKLPLTEQKRLCLEYGIHTDSVSADSSNLLHSKTAAFLSRDIFGINDIVFGAVFNHTTGKAGMNVFEKIIFLSDYIEPTRKQQVCADAREKFLNDAKQNGFNMRVLDTAVADSLDSTLLYLLSTKNPIAAETIQARNHLILQYSRKKLL